MFQKGKYIKCGIDNKCKYCQIKKKFPIPIGCISLSGSKYRPYIEKQFHKYGYCQNAGFWIVDRHPKGGKRGCFESHKALNHYFHNHNYTKAIILEDDIKFLGKIPKEIIKLPTDAYLLYLGWYPSYCNYLEKYDSYKINNNIVAIKGPFLTTHAYMSTTKLMNWIEKLNYDNQHIDQIFSKKLSKHSYGLYPIIVVQKNGLESSISNFDIYKYIDKEKFMIMLSHITIETKCSLNFIILTVIILLILILTLIIILAKN